MPLPARRASCAGALVLLVLAALLTGLPAHAGAGTSEQQGHHGVNTFTDPHNASGVGPRIAPAAWVDVACKVYEPTIASVNPDGYWYRIASSPWNGSYYAPANTFMNGDPWTGPYTHNTDFGVPDCDSSPAAPADPAATAAPAGQVQLAQGPAGPSGYRYAITLDGFPAGTGVPVSCYDSVSPAGFYSFTMPTDSSGHASTAGACYSADGPEHWVRAGGVDSAHVTWSGSSAPAGSGTGGTSGTRTSEASSTAGGGAPGSGGSGGRPGTSSQPAAAPQHIGDPCQERYPTGGSQRSHATFGGLQTDYDRTASRYQVCEGFGGPDGLTYSAGMKCAMVGAIAAWADEVEPFAKTCEAVSVLDSLSKGDYLNVVGSVGCEVFSDLFATVGGVGIAGVASETGPAAVAIGVGAYKALRSGLSVVCGALFDGGAVQYGHNLESKHEYNVMLDVVRNGRCLQFRRVFGLSRWSAVRC